MQMVQIRAKPNGSVIRELRVPLIDRLNWCKAQWVCDLGILVPLFDRLNTCRGTEQIGANRAGD